MRTIGIDAIALAVPDGYLDLADLAEARGVPPKKFIDGLGLGKMAVARAHEDPVALAATAAARLFATAGVDPASIGMCVVGTETAVDHSKPIAAYLHRLLGLPEHCRIFETKHACYGGTVGLLGAVDWIAAGSAHGKKALIICSDIARYALESAGEPTQGAGAVALLVSESPRLFALEPGVTGSYAKDVDDFWRPLYTKNAVVDGHHSVDCYLDALVGAERAWRERSLAEGLGGEVARSVYHVPFGKMAKKAHRHLLAQAGLSEADADRRYDLEVEPSLLLMREVGNVYTGSLYLALTSLLHHEAARLEGQRVALFSYGSGCGAEYFAGRVAAGAGDFAARLELVAPLLGRRRYTFSQYEQIRKDEEATDRRPVGPEAPHLAPGRFAFVGLDGERRIYAGGLSRP